MDYKICDVCEGDGCFLISSPFELNKDYEHCDACNGNGAVWTISGKFVVEYEQISYDGVLHCPSWHIKNSETNTRISSSYGYSSWAEAQTEANKLQELEVS